MIVKLELDTQDIKFITEALDNALESKRQHKTVACMVSAFMSSDQAEEVPEEIRETIKQKADKERDEDNSVLEERVTLLKAKFILAKQSAAADAIFHQEKSLEVKP